MEIDITGIKWESCYEDRIKKAKKVTQLLSSKGMNLFWWRLSSSLLAFKTFIRSTLDYGVALYPPPDILNSLQKVVDEALRRIASARFSTSRVALAKCFMIETMNSRAMELSQKFKYRLINMDKTTPASIAFKAINPEYVHKEQSTDEIWDMRKVLWDKEAIKRPGGNAMAIDPTVRVPRNFWMSDNRIDKEDSQLIVEWQTGGIAFHQPCNLCGDELSREHACICGDIENELGNDFDIKEWQAIECKKPPQILFINHALNRVIGEKRSVRRNRRVSAIAKAIFKMKTLCGGCYKDEKGFWKRREAQYQYHQNPSITINRAREAALRNRKVGRPRGVT